jgi:2-haloacid dehalogenase
MSKIDCVVWDIGNVLIRWEPRILFRKMGYSDAQIDRMYAETKLMEINHRVLDAGGSFADETEKLAVAFPQHANFLRSFFSRWVEALNGAVDENVRVLSGLKRANIPIHMISNINHETFEKACELFPFLNEFDHCIVSGRIGLVKPDREIFEYWSQETGVHPTAAVFIDDNANNIATANALGFHTVHYTEGKVDVRARLVALGVPVSEA